MKSTDERVDIIKIPNLKISDWSGGKFPRNITFIEKMWIDEDGSLCFKVRHTPMKEKNAKNML